MNLWQYGFNIPNALAPILTCGFALIAWLDHAKPLKALSTIEHAKAPEHVNMDTCARIPVATYLASPTALGHEQSQAWRRDGPAL